MPRQSVWSVPIILDFQKTLGISLSPTDLAKTRNLLRYWERWFPQAFITEVIERVAQEWQTTFRPTGLWWGSKDPRWPTLLCKKAWPQLLCICLSGDLPKLQSIAVQPLPSDFLHCFLALATRSAWTGQWNLNTIVTRGILRSMVVRHDKCYSLDQEGV